MRLLFSGVAAAGLLASHLAAAECNRPAEDAALDMASLKSTLMVIALTCHTQDRYNAFVNKYKSELGGQERAASSYFSRAYGRAGRARQDDYVTQLANSKSQLGLQQGNQFCARNADVWD